MSDTEKKKKITDFVVKKNAVSFQNVKGSKGNVFMSAMDDTTFKWTGSIQYIAVEQVRPKYRNKSTTYERLSAVSIDDILCKISKARAY